MQYFTAVDILSLHDVRPPTMVSSWSRARELLQTNDLSVRSKAWIRRSAVVVKMQFSWFSVQDQLHVFMDGSCGVGCNVSYDILLYIYI